MSTTTIYSVVFHNSSKHDNYAGKIGLGSFFRHNNGWTQTQMIRAVWQTMNGVKNNLLQKENPATVSDISNNNRFFPWVNNFV